MYTLRTDSASGRKADLLVLVNKLAAPESTLVLVNKLIAPGSTTCILCRLGLPWQIGLLCQRPEGVVDGVSDDAPVVLLPDAFVPVVDQLFLFLPVLHQFDHSFRKGGGVVADQQVLFVIYFDALAPDACGDDRLFHR